MPRTDREYWARLRIDAASSWAAGLAVLSAMASALALMGLVLDGPQSADRGNPLYWAIMLPIVWWASELMGFEPRPVRLMAPVTFLAPVLALIWLCAAYYQQTDPMLWIIAATISLVTAVASRIFYRRSLLKREGPAR